MAIPQKPGFQTLHHATMFCSKMDYVLFYISDLDSESLHTIPNSVFIQANFIHIFIDIGHS